MAGLPDNADDTQRADGNIGQSFLDGCGAVLRNIGGGCGNRRPPPQSPRPAGERRFHAMDRHNRDGRLVDRYGNCIGDKI